VDRADKLYEQARVLAESGADLEMAAPELLRVAAGDCWVVEAALARCGATARRTPLDPTNSHSLILLRSLLSLSVLR
jgi:hypothetical protein